MRAMDYKLLKGYVLDAAFSLILGPESVRDLRGFCLTPLHPPFVRGELKGGVDYRQKKPLKCHIQNIIAAMKAMKGV
jgi:hypothetical protein